MTADYTLTFGAAAVQLSSVFTNAETPLPSARFCSLQPDGGNSNVIYVGGNNHGIGVASTSYGFRLEAPVSTVPPAPFIVEVSQGCIDLSEFWVKGTNGEKLHIFVKL